MGIKEAEKFWSFFETMPDKVQLDYMNERFGERAFDTTKDWDEFDTDYALLKSFKANINTFKIPSMCVGRDDLISRFEGHDNFAEEKIKIENISDEDMQFIANQMTDMMMEDFWFALDEAYKVLQREQERREEKQNE